MAATMLKLKSSDNEIFEVEEQVIIQSKTIKNMLEDLESLAGEISLPILSQPLAKILDWCKKRHQEGNDKKKKNKEGEGTSWENEFLEEMKADTDMWYHILNAANFLNIPVLLDRLYQLAADSIKGKTPEQIRQIFKIQNDFTPEQEAQMIDSFKD